ncbi:unnamed protein product, partial [Ectocarpus sp. 8 AP-2014]
MTGTINHGPGESGMMEGQQQQEQQQQQQQGVNSIQGAWVLDLSRSDTMRRYLQVCGVPEERSRIHVDAERRHGGLNVIQVGDGMLTIYKSTFANRY